MINLTVTTKNWNSHYSMYMQCVMITNMIIKYNYFIILERVLKDDFYMT